MTALISRRPDLTYTQMATAVLILALPFIIVIIALHGLHDQFITYHGNDEKDFHYPIILRFIETFPKMELWDYRSSTTPLFHVVFAVLGKFISPSLPFLRAVNVGVTYLAGLILFVIFRKVLEADFWSSVLSALALVLLPYVFGISFLLLTDNLAMMFAVIAIYFALLYIHGGRWNLIAFAAFFAMCSIMTRQLYLWLFVLLFAASVWRSRDDAAEPISGIFALIALAAAPLIVLFVSWGALTPEIDHDFFQVGLRPIVFFTACVGAYGAPFLAVQVWENRWPRLSTLAITIGAILLITTVLLWFSPLKYFQPPLCREAVCPTPTDGYLWRASLWLPSIGGSSLLFWILIPFGLGTVLYAWREQQFRSLPLVIYFSYGVFSLANVSLFQKYFDFPAMLVCCLTFYSMRRTRAFQIILLTFCLGFALYATGNPFQLCLNQACP